MWKVFCSWLLLGAVARDLPRVLGLARMVTNHRKKVKPNAVNVKEKIRKKPLPSPPHPRAYVVGFYNLLRSPALTVSEEVNVIHSSE